MIVYNTGNKTIFIVTNYEIDPHGGPATPTKTICIKPGDGIDLSVIGLEVKNGS